MAKPSSDTFPPEINAILAKLFRLLDSDDEQIALLPETIQRKIRSGPKCDRLPNSSGEFGRSVTNPIPVNGPLGEIVYLSRLRTGTGSPVMFHRVRSEDGLQNAVDVYEVLSLDRKVRETLFFSMYHPTKSKLVPQGYKYANALDKHNIIYGVNHIVADFPQKLDAHVRKWEMDNLGVPLPVSQIRNAINGSPIKPSILSDDDFYPDGSPSRSIQEDFLKLEHAVQDQRFKGKEVVVGLDGTVRAIESARST